MPEYKVVSEIYAEQNYKTANLPNVDGNVVSEFLFNYPCNNEINCDEDGDLLVQRQTGVVQIEHSQSTALSLVGLQVWRGALLLADLALHWGSTNQLKNSTILELGAGTGLSSFVAGIYAKKIICTDVNMGGILDLIRLNYNRNKSLIKADFLVDEIDFTKDISSNMRKELANVDLIFAADVIYDDNLTESFVKALDVILNTPPAKTVIIALEKRFVFTMAELDSVAPCYETFLSLIDKFEHKWKIEMFPVDFPQYFKYDRVKELIMWKIERRV